MLSGDDYQRYSRQLLLDQIDEAGQQKLAQSSVAVVGLGGLGNLAASYLAAAGVGHLVLIDDDEVELNNLQRQILYRSSDVGLLKADQAARHLRLLNPNIDILPVSARLTQSNSGDYLLNVDAVLDCTDNFPSRFAINQACYQYGKPLFIGAASQFNGQYLALDPTASHGCYRCLYEPEQGPDNQCLSQGILGPVVGMMGMLQALDTLKFLTQAAPIEWGKLRCFDGLTTHWQTFELPKLTSCPVCGNDHETSY